VSSAFLALVSGVVLCSVVAVALILHPAALGVPSCVFELSLSE